MGMKKRPFGTTGYTISELGYGAWGLGGAMWLGSDDAQGGEALRAAQRAMRARPNRQHPFYWAGFIQAGDWRPLDADPPAACR